MNSYHEKRILEIIKAVLESLKQNAVVLILIQAAKEKEDKQPLWSDVTVTDSSSLVRTKCYSAVGTRLAILINLKATAETSDGMVFEFEDWNIYVVISTGDLTKDIQLVNATKDAVEKFLLEDFSRK